jgi:F1F0 ATPase subunit 2
MTAVLPYLIGLLIGLLTGLFYFAGLWLTVKKVPRSKNPNRLLAFSAAARLLPTLAVMFILIRQNPGAFLAMLITFFAVRFMMINKIAGRKNRNRSDAAKDTLIS